jgi:hypothetical protein
MWRVHMVQQNLHLDDRIYCLQRTKDLPEELRALVHEADRLYLQDKDEQSEVLVKRVESECRERGIVIYSPSFA